MRRTIKRLLRLITRRRVADIDRPIGVIQSVSEDENGLHVTYRLLDRR